MNADISAPITIAASFLFFFSVIAFYAVRSPEERRFLMPLALVAYTLKAMAVPVYYFALMSAGLDGFAYFDSIAYHYDGLEISEEISRGIDFSSAGWTAVDPGFPVVTGVLYWIVGPNTLVMRLMNCALSVFMLLYVYRTSRLVFEDPKIARMACYLAAFLPYSATIVINHRKDPLVALVASFMIYHAIRLIRAERNWPKEIIWVGIGVLVISFFRSGYVFPFLGTVVVCVSLARRSLIEAAALSVIMVTLLAGIQLAISDTSSTSVAASTERFRGKLEHSAGLGEGGGLVRLVRIASPVDVYKLPIATVVAAILPYPPYFRGNLPSILQSWMNLLNLAFLPAMIIGAWSAIRREEWRKTIPVVLFPLFFLVVHGLVNVGVPRYRETVFPMMLILAAVGLYQRGGRMVYGAVYGVLIVLGAAAYFGRY